MTGWTRAGQSCWDPRPCVSSGRAPAVLRSSAPGGRRLPPSPLPHPRPLSNGSQGGVQLLNQSLGLRWGRASGASVRTRRAVDTNVTSVSAVAELNRWVKE